jgi:hypothetical protein
MLRDAENRRSHRYPLRAPVRAFFYSADGRRSQGYHSIAHDISGCGLSFISGYRPTVGQLVDLEMSNRVQRAVVCRTVEENSLYLVGCQFEDPAV